jgi:hypothetical protein
VLALLASSAANSRVADALVWADGVGLGIGELSIGLGLGLGLGSGLALGLGTELDGVGVAAGDVTALGEVVTAKGEVLACVWARPQATAITSTAIHSRLICH